MEVGFAKENETKRKETFCKRIKDNGSRKDWQTAKKRLRLRVYSHIALNLTFQRAFLIPCFVNNYVFSFIH